ncbi:hypothetical protein Pcinc_020798 [Petrolisthes cinctipes]|uniref:Matrin-type domain-containing protein n=1 Tax=Petrolisthes cinctipes TaxID=88211 RepID=A0AAE1FH88_PETCI|nr:hypothetical protein Pcinc_020798 [Petrolisthes cinctipes]
MDGEATSEDKISYEPSGSSTDQGKCLEDTLPSLMNQHIPPPPEWYSTKQKELNKLYGEGVIVPIHHEDPDAGKFEYHCLLCSTKLNSMTMVIHCNGQWHAKMKRKFQERQERIDIEGKDKLPGFHVPKNFKIKKKHANDTLEERTWLAGTFGEGIITIRKNDVYRTSYYCELCAVYETSKNGLAVHTNSFRHSRLEKERNISIKIDDTPVVRASLDEIYGKGVISILPLAMNPNSNVYFCRICTAKLLTGKMMFAHSQSQTHKENLQKMQGKIGDRKARKEKDPLKNRKVHDESSSEIKRNNEEDIAARQQSSTGKVTEWTESKQRGQKRSERWKLADVKPPRIHPSRERGFPGSKARHQYSPPYSTSSTTEASSALPYNLYSSATYDHPNNMPFDHHSDNLPFDHHPDNLPFDHHPDNLPFDHHPDNNNFAHHQHTNSFTFENSSNPPLSLPPPKPRFEHAKVCSIKSSLINKVECCRLYEEDIGEATGLVMKLVTAVEDYFTHNRHLKNARQAKRTLGEAGTQFERLKLLLEEEVSKKNK